MQVTMNIHLGFSCSAPPNVSSIFTSWTTTALPAIHFTCPFYIFNFIFYTIWKITHLSVIPTKPVSEEKMRRCFPVRCISVIAHNHIDIFHEGFRQFLQISMKHLHNCIRRYQSFLHDLTAIWPGNESIFQKYRIAWVEDPWNTSTIAFGLIFKIASFTASTLYLPTSFHPSWWRQILWISKMSWKFRKIA